MNEQKRIKKAHRELVTAGISVKKNFPLKKFANFKIGGKADLFIEIKDIKELEHALKILRGNNIKYMAAGNMTNLLIKDGRVKIAFLRLAGEFNRITLKAKRLVYAGAGIDNTKLLNFMVKNGLGGLEFMAGIPGTVGGAVYMNAGAFGKGIGSYVRRVYFTGRDGKSGAMVNKGSMFSYRKSIFQENHAVMTGVELAVIKKGRKESALEMREIIKSRHEKHPWDAACAGSFFKNTPDITAGKLIEMAGLKGMSVGDAKVSEKHANFLINKGGAAFKDVMRLAAKVKKEVYKKFKVRLEEEVVIIK